MVSGPSEVRPPKTVFVEWVERADQMDRALRRQAPWADVIIMAAAVCDYRPAIIRRRKVARYGSLTLRLVATPDLIARLPRRAGQLVVGFALESEAALQHARRKLSAKRLDLIVGQRMDASGGPFGARAVNAFLLAASGELTTLERTTKRQLARAILDKIERLWYGAVPARRAARSPQPRTRRHRREPSLIHGTRLVASLPLSRFGMACA